MVQAITGDYGCSGIDISAEAKNIKAIPLKLTCTEKDREFAAKAVPECLVVSGVVFISRYELEKWQHKTQKIIFHFPLIFNVRYIGEAKAGSGDILPDTQYGQLQWCKSLGLPISQQVCVAKGFYGMRAFNQKIRDSRNSLDYDIYGAEMIPNTNALLVHLLNNYTIASLVLIVFPPQEAITELLNIDFQVNGYGVIVPIALLRPVQMGNTTISNYTLNKMGAEISHFDLKIGDTVIIRRIGYFGKFKHPQIKGVVYENRAKNEGQLKDIVFPTTCPECGSKVERDYINEVIYYYNNGSSARRVPYYCTNRLTCPAQRSFAIMNYASSSAMNIDGLSYYIIDELVRQQLVRTVADLYTLTEEKLANLTLTDITGQYTLDETNAKKLVANIAASKTRPLNNFIDALGIRGVDTYTATILASDFKTIDNLMAATTEQLCTISHISKNLATNITNFFAEEQNRAVIAHLKALGVNPTPVC